MKNAFMFFANAGITAKPEEIYSLYTMNTERKEKDNMKYEVHACREKENVLASYMIKNDTESFYAEIRACSSYGKPDGAKNPYKVTVKLTQEEGPWIIYSADKPELKSKYFEIRAIALGEYKKSLPAANAEETKQAEIAREESILEQIEAIKADAPQLDDPFESLI